MKKSYMMPVMKVEQFVANTAVSTCTVQGGINWTFDCMYGPEVDTANVISTQIPNVNATCGLNIGYAGGILTARDYSSQGSHSNNNSSLATWTTSGLGNSGGPGGKPGGGSSDSYLQVVYSGGEGLLYTDGDATTDASVWSVQTGYVKHSSDRGGTHHMVAPVINTQTINASW
ncbi:MAG: hypothetical protein ACI4C1_09090 [Lachnospiraceae bacterium]